MQNPAASLEDAIASLYPEDMTPNTRPDCVEEQPFTTQGHNLSFDPSYPRVNVVMTSTSAMFDPPHDNSHFSSSLSHCDAVNLAKHSANHMQSPIVLGHVMDEFSSMVRQEPPQSVNFSNAAGSHFGVPNAETMQQRPEWYSSYPPVPFPSFSPAGYQPGIMQPTYSFPTGYNQHNNMSEGSSSYNQSQWTDEEHNKFLVALEKFCPEACRARERGKVFVGLGAGVAKKISQAVGTRSVLQVRSHAQKHFLRESKRSKTDKP
uniref:Uncharacterized protein n=1 Tax=Hanusia phi TaxID=3032 RepID=A0A6T7TQR1_9CRYP|mmetsp:Transcript_9746/g.22226  ORF Transcript_9746/g.22226 Transcript_9746/m.22226 type:complete len:262 (+) Transcript_9746:197-982(+)|eukprot:761688-Hanusia_phi.AAC.2